MDAFDVPQGRGGGWVAGLRSLLVSVAAMLWLCGVGCSVAAVVARAGEWKAELTGPWILMALLVLVAAGGVLFERFTPLLLRVGCHLVAALGLLVITWNVLNDPPWGWRVDVDADPSVFWTTLATSCIAMAGLVLTAFAVLRARPGRPRSSRRGVVMAVLCGVLLAGLGATTAGALIRQELELTRSVTTTAPQELPAMTPVFDARQTTGEWVRELQFPEIKGMTELHPGVRGPIVADNDTVLGLDGATGDLLWVHDLRDPGRQLVKLWELPRRPRNLVVSPDGTAAAFVSCTDRDEPVLTMLDAVTGRQRFSLNLTLLPGSGSGSRDPGACSPQVAMTDHVVVVNGIAHDLVTGSELWRHGAEPGFVAGPNGSSHLLTASSTNEAAFTKEALAAMDVVCNRCSLGPHGIVSDQDPTVVVDQVSRAATTMGQRSPLLMRGWLMEHDQDTGSNAWLNLDTQQRIPVESTAAMNDMRWRTDTLTFVVSTEPDFSRDPDRQLYHVLDPWTGETDTVDGFTESSGPLGVGVWVTESMKLVRPDDTTIASPDTHTFRGPWMIFDTIRTPHGIVSNLSNGAKEVIVMYR